MPTARFRGNSSPEKWGAIHWYFEGYAMLQPSNFQSQKEIEIEKG